MSNENLKKGYSTGKTQRDPAQEAFLNQYLEWLANEGVLDRKGWKYADDGSRKPLYSMTEYGRAWMTCHKTRVAKECLPSVDGPVESVKC